MKTNRKAANPSVLPSRMCNLCFGKKPQNTCSTTEFESATCSKKMLSNCDVQHLNKERALFLLYLFFLLLDCTVLFSGGIVGLIKGSNNLESSSQFSWCIVCVVSTPMLSMLALMTTDYNQYPSPCDPKKCLKVGVHCFVNAVKIILLIVGGCLYSSGSLLLFRVIFWYFIAFYALLLGLPLLYFVFVLVSIIFSSVFCHYCMRCQTGVRV